MSSLSHVFARLRALPDGAREHKALSRGLGGTAVLGSPGFTAVARTWCQPPMEPVLQTVLWGQPVQLFTPPTPRE
ncbi:hypothetical protein [Actinomyces sp.]